MARLNSRFNNLYIRMPSMVKPIEAAAMLIYVASHDSDL